jgi:serine/threonine protein kinase
VISEGQILNGRYRLLSLEGEGGMAFVYKSYDEELDRTVAVKVLRAEYDSGDAFRSEARASARLPHPNIVTVYDVGQDAGAHYIVMEYVAGQNLKDLIQAEAPFRLGRAMDIISQVCTAVGFAHEKGIIHCDLKPQNVLILPDGQAKVTDFGIARALSNASPEQQGQVWGTPYYASPELVCGKPLTAAADVYAIGVMLYEMLTGSLPFEGQSAAEIARLQVVNAPTPIQHLNPRVPRYVQQIVDRALAKDPAGRYSTAAQMAKFLNTYRQHGEAITQPLQPILAADTDASRAAATEPPPVPSGLALQEQTRRGFDWFLLLLIGLAFLAVMGLFPLWGTVISRALGQSTLAPTVTPTRQETSSTTPPTGQPVVNAPPTPTPRPLVSVPDLIGKELEEARRLTQEKGLQLTVTEQRHDTQVPAAHVITQTSPPGEQVAEGSQVGIVVSLGPEMVTMPGVVGFPAAIEQLELEDLGLITIITETWSLEPIGLVITQTPEAGTQITVGSVVTLAVSSGPSGEVRANLDDKVVLLSCEFNDVTFRPGDSVQMIVTWQVLDALPEPYTVFIHITDPSGRILAQLDRPPLGGSRPTNTWRAGERLLDPYALSLPANMPPGLYWVRIGLYRGSHRLPVKDPGLAKADQDAVLVRQIEVRKG